MLRNTSKECKECSPPPPLCHWENKTSTTPLVFFLCVCVCVYWATSYKLSLANFSRGESYRSPRTSQLLHSAVFFASHRFWKEKFVPHVYKAIWKQNKAYRCMALQRTPPFSFPLPVPYHHFEQPNKLKQTTCICGQTPPAFSCTNTGPAVTHH